MGTRVGSIGYATCQGLGVLLKDFYDNGVVTDVFQVRHRCYKEYNWYPRWKGDLRSFIETMDVMFFFETPFFKEAIPLCKELEVRTVLMPMYECTPKWAEDVDQIINPSLLDQRYYPQGVHLPVPIPKWVKWRKRSKVEVFVHNAGHGGLRGRNGTQELLAAMEYVRSPIKLILRSQDDNLPPVDRDRVDVRVGTFPQEQLYDEGDVFIFPEKFNGLSLPLQEAYASGMTVMATGRFPNNTYLPNNLLIPTMGSSVQTILHNPVNVAQLHPRDIAHCIDRWYGRDISPFSVMGHAFKEYRSWDKLKQVWDDATQTTYQGSPG